MSEEIEKELLPFEEEENYRSPDGEEEAESDGDSAKKEKSTKAPSEKLAEKIRSGGFGKLALLLTDIE